MYQGGRPDDEARAIHRRYASGPIPRLVPVAGVLETVGRKSGALIRVPVVVAPWHGSWYLVSMLGEDANWVRNVRAAGGKAVLLRGRRREVRLVEVPGHERAPIIKRYLLFAVGARPHLPVRWRDPVAAFEAIADRYPVFRVERPDGT